MEEKKEQVDKKTTSFQEVMAVVIILLSIMVINAKAIYLSSAGLGYMIGYAIPVGLITWIIYYGTTKKPDRTLLGFSYYFIIASLVWLAITVLFNI